MPKQSSILGNNEGSWDSVVACLEAFSIAWDRNGPPSISQYLPDVDPNVRRRILIELIKFDLEQRERAGCQKKLQDYCLQFPSLVEDHGPPIELIYEVFHLSEKKDHPITVEDLIEQFPERANEIKQWCQPLGGLTTCASSRATNVRHLSLSAGDTLEDFLLIREVGQGAFATVWLAQQLSLGRMVALKIAQTRGDEARTLAQLDHPNIVRIYDQTVILDGQFRLVYEQFLPGGTLADVVQRVNETPADERTYQLLLECAHQATRESGLGMEITPSRNHESSSWTHAVTAIGVDLALALDHAHSAGILHHDVKPANVLLGADGSVHLADFNTSTMANHPASGVSACFGGSLPYMSPEHLEAFDCHHERQATDLDARSDIYSLSVMLIELLCGRRPFIDPNSITDNMQEVLANMTATREEERYDLNLCSSAADAHPLMVVLQQCLAADRDKRPESGEELAMQLQLCLVPRVAWLMTSFSEGWRFVCGKSPFWTVAACALLPNLILAAFNYNYNHRLLMEMFADPMWSAKQEVLQLAFYRTSLMINACAFGGGILFVIAFTRPITRSICKPECQPAQRQRARAKSLLLGEVAASIGVIEWFLAGIFFPIGMWLSVGQLPFEAVVLFLQSPLVCGLLAAVYPFFLTALMSLRVFYPKQLKSGKDFGRLHGDTFLLKKLSQRSSFFLVVAGGVPLVTLGLLLVVHSSVDRMALILLTAAGLIGLLFANWARQIIDGDIEAILRFANPLRALDEQRESA